MLMVRFSLCNFRKVALEWILHRRVYNALYCDWSNPHFTEILGDMLLHACVPLHQIMVTDSVLARTYIYDKLDMTKLNRLLTGVAVFFI